MNSTKLDGLGLNPTSLSYVRGLGFDSAPLCFHLRTHILGGGGRFCEASPRDIKHQTPSWCSLYCAYSVLQYRCTLPRFSHRHQYLRLRTYSSITSEIQPMLYFQIGIHVSSRLIRTGTMLQNRRTS